MNFSFMLLSVNGPAHFRDPSANASELSAFTGVPVKMGST